MKKSIMTICFFLLGTFITKAQNIIPLDTTHWEISARAHLFETFKGKDAIYIQGAIILKDQTFLNGTIEFDIYLKQEQSFPGVNFRVNGSNFEQFYIRPHLPGKPDANQVAPSTNGISPWQLYFGPKYSFPYKYTYDDWTHVKIVVNGNRAQVYLDYAEKPHLSWNLFHEAKEGRIAFKAGGRFGAYHLANIKINKNETDIVDFKAIERKPIENLIPTWKVSDKFEETLLDDPNKISAVIKSRKWNHTIKVEEGTAANISRKLVRYDGKKGNTVFAKVIIHSDKKQWKLLEFGYSDRVVAILNGKPMYRGSNRWRSRDYRYLGTVGLFDGIYLPLKKGRNILLMAVSEDFGGWLITGRVKNKKGIRIE
ncbi:MAG: hypothetical protein JXQ93_14070 [Flavobacteriaceae bacterium]